VLVDECGEAGNVSVNSAAIDLGAWRRSEKERERREKGETGARRERWRKKERRQESHMV
jgi:hypothetical protein